MMYWKRIIALASLALTVAVVRADVLEFTNGDRISGSFVSEEDGMITFRSDLLGELTVSADSAKVLFASDGEAADAAAAIEAQALGAAPTPDEPTEKQRKDVKEEADDFNAMVDRFREKFQSYIPQGWTGNFRFGLSFVDTNTSTEAWNLNLRASKKSGLNNYALRAFYNFSKQTQTNGTTNKTLDKWGGGFVYSRDLSERWFLQSDTDYLRDLVKNIDHQVTQTVSLGYKVYDTETFKLSLLPGVAGQYLEAQGFNERWLGYVTFGDEMSYIFNSIFRLEQSAGIRLNPTDTSEYQWNANLAFISKLSDWIEASLNYQYTYDSTVGPGKVRGEQQITFALGIPF